MARRIVLFGATGRVGGRAYKDLLSSGASSALELVVVTRHAQNFAGGPAGLARVVEYDLDRPEREGLNGLKAILDGADALLLITGYDQRMLAQSKAVIDAAQAVGVRHVVHVGAHAAADTTIVHLGWHQLIEAYLARSGLGWTCLRPTSYMQNLAMLRAIANAPPRILPHYIGTAATSWIDAEDVGRAAARILLDSRSHLERSYSLGTESATMDRIAGILTEETGALWRADARDPEDFRRTMLAAGADPVYMACVTTIFHRTSAGELPDLNETFDSFSEITGESPTGLRAFLMRERAAFEHP